MTPASKTPNILLAGRLSRVVFDGEKLDEIAAAAPGATIRLLEDDKDFDEDVAEAEIVAGPVPPASFGKARRLRWVHSWRAGPDDELYPALIDSDVVMTCCKGNGAKPLAEHAMMLMLMLNRDARRWVEAQRNRLWEPFYHGELNGLTLEIIGTGHSGQDLALKGKAFHMRVLGLRRHVQATPNFDAIYGADQLHAFLAQCDFVVVTAPYTPEIQDMLGEAEFRAMKPSAHYICFSRGGIADDDALYRAIDEEWIAGAGLDAHGEEPLPADSRFWTLKNTIITPHNGATTTQTRARGYEIFLDNLRRYVAGEPLLNSVDKRQGY